MADAADTELSIPLPPPRLSRDGLSRLGGLLAGLDRLDAVLRVPDYPAEADPGIPFGRYVLRSRLGAGAYGTVVLADDPRLKRRVVVKVPHPFVLADPDARERFVREARAAGVLDHPGIVPVFEAGEVDELPYLAAGYVDGPTLAGWLATDPAVPPAAAARLVASLARAVQHAHERGVLHCDLKPANVLLSGMGDGVSGLTPDRRDDFSAVRGHTPNPIPDTPPVPRVADFGMARILTDDPAQTRTYQHAGTPLYMAPEQARGDRRALTARTDVHALGAILFELLTRRPPYAGSDGPAVLECVRSAPPPCPGAANPAVPRDLRAVCRRCLEKDPRDRYPSAAALADDLERFLTGFPVDARRVGPVTRAVRWTRRNPAGTAAVGVAVSLLAGLGVLLADRWAAGVRHEAELRAEAAERAEAEDRAAAAEFLSAAEAVRERRVELEPDWPGRNLAELRRLAASPAAAAHLPRLRTEAALALGGFDLGTPRTLAAGFKGYSPVFGPDGTQLAVGGWGADAAGNCHVKVVDVATGAEVRSLTYRGDADWGRRYAAANKTTPAGDGCRAIAWSPDGRWLVVGTRSGRLVRWDLREPAPTPASWPHAPPGPRPQDDHPRTLAFTASGRVLVSFGNVQAVGWDAANGWAEAFRADRDNPHVPRPAAAADPVIVALTDGTAFRVLDGRPWLWPVAFPKYTVAAGPGGRWGVGQFPGSQFVHLRAGAGDGWPTRHFRLPGDERTDEGAIYDLSHDPRGHLLVTTAEHDRHLAVWSVGTGHRLAARTTAAGSLRAAFRPDGRQLAVATHGGVLVYDLPARPACEPLAVGPVPLHDADRTPDGRTAVAIGTPHLHDAHTLTARWDAAGRPAFAWDARIGSGNIVKVTAVAPDGRWEAYPIGPARIEVRRADGSLAWAPETKIRDMRSGPGGRLWTVGDAGLRGWDIDRAGELTPAAVCGRTAGLMYDCVTPGAADVWAGRADGAVCRHPAAGGPADRTFRPFFSSGVVGVARSADGRRLLVGSATGAVKLLDADTGDVLIDLPDAHRDAAQAGVFLPGGTFATGGRDRAVRLWDAAGKLVLALPQTRPVRRLFADPTGRELVVLAEGEGGLWRWHLDRLRAGLADLGLAID